MEQHKYITISEFAKRVGMVRQAIYYRADNDLKPFVKNVKGKKCLSEAALSLFETNVSKDSLDSDFNSDLDGMSDTFDALDNLDKPANKSLTPDERFVDALKSEIEHYKSQLETTIEMWEDDKQKISEEQQRTAEANKRIQCLQEQIFKLSDDYLTRIQHLEEQIIKMSNDNCEIAKQTNMLLSQSQQISAKLLSPAQPPPEPQPEPEPAPKKKGFFDIFKKNNRS